MSYLSIGGGGVEVSRAMSERKVFSRGGIGKLGKIFIYALHGSRTLLIAPQQYHSFHKRYHLARPVNAGVSPMFLNIGAAIEYIEISHVQSMRESAPV